MNSKCQELEPREVEGKTTDARNSSGEDGANSDNGEGKNSAELSPFELLPVDLHRMVFEKLDLRSFFTVKQCSKQMSSICQQSGHRPAFHIGEMQLDIQKEQSRWLYDRSRVGTRALADIPPHCFKVHVDRLIVGGLALAGSGFVSVVDQEMFRARIVSINEVQIRSPIVGSAWNFNLLLENFRVRQLFLCGPFTAPDFDMFACQPAVRKLSCLKLVFVNGSVSSENVLALRAPYLHLPTVEAATVNTLLKEWQAGLRDIVAVQFDAIDEIAGLNQVRLKDECLTDLKYFNDSGLIEIARRSDNVVLSVDFSYLEKVRCCIDIKHDSSDSDVCRSDSEENDSEDSDEFEDSGDSDDSYDSEDSEDSD